MNVLALIPARVGSKGIPNKNFRDLAGVTPLVRAVSCAWLAGVDDVYISTDHPTLQGVVTWERNTKLLYAPAPLHTDDCPMIDVVRDALDRVPGPPEQIIVLLQPTQPLRQPKHVQAAITLLHESQADSVVSVVEAESPDKLLSIERDGFLSCWDEPGAAVRWATERRQDARPAWKRDGTVYAFWRRTVEQDGNIYGLRSKPLIIPAEETQALDTADDWRAAERRLRDREP